MAFPDINEWMKREHGERMVDNPEGRMCQGCGDHPEQLSEVSDTCWPCLRAAYAYDQGEHDALEEFARLMGEAFEPLTKWQGGS